MNKRTMPLAVNKILFKQIGYKLIDDIADFFDTIQQRPVTTGESPQQLQAHLGNTSFPQHGMPLDQLFTVATQLLFDHSLFNGHPKFFGYITSSPAPAGALADMLAAAVNPNVGANILSPMATAIERQTIKWLAEFIGVPTTFGGLLVSGGNMANFTGFLVARTIKAPQNIKENGICNNTQKLTVYCPKTTHTWVEKAVVLFGLGTKSIRWVDVDDNNKMNNNLLQEMIAADKQNDCTPLMVIGTAGDVSTGAVDDLKGIAAICKQHNLWFHIDGAYGIPAAIVPELKYLFEGIEEANSIALDPHKWLYSPLEAGCTLVKNPAYLKHTYSSHPVYYNFGNDDTEDVNFYEYGLQNSRGFRALKVWINLQYAGRSGYEKLIGDDIKLSRLLYQLADKNNELEAVSQNLSITTFRYIPLETNKDDNSFLNKLNELLLNNLQQKGEAFLSNAVVKEKYCLRACIVNFRTAEKDMHELVEIVIKEGRKAYEIISKSEKHSSIK